ncbi:unnamed protein product [Periconia digitata]|uniref:Uncharacterized protein n=1 Tax=Periconia digitata TaxID=1303443 RepID=A0A9W4U4U0_9PLEO|nr:unnamed protein product [Periconia digitata]
MSQMYKPLPVEEDAVASRDTSTDHSSDEKFEWRTNKRRTLRSIANSNIAWIIQTAMFSVSVTLFAVTMCSRASENVTKVPTTWSPVNEAIKYEIKHFDLAPIPDGPFVGKGDDVDAMWEWATDGIPDTMVTKSELLKMNMDPTGALEVTDPKTGRHGYRVAIEVFHQLHCLNLLRQANHKAHYAPLGGDTAAEPEDLHGHLDHCIDALRQFVMCQGDTNVFPFRFPFNDGDPWPDYSSPRMCRNFDKIRDWAVEHGVERGVDEPEH